MKSKNYFKIILTIIGLANIITPIPVLLNFINYHSNNNSNNTAIFLDVKIKPLKFNNTYLLAATQSIIEYTTNQNISQSDLAQLKKEKKDEKTSIHSAISILNNFIFSKKKNDKYVYKYLSKDFGKTNCQQEIFYKAIHHSLANNFPVLLWINGHFSPHYKKPINHAVIINGVKKANKIEDYKYYILDNNFLNTPLEIKSSDLSSLFATNGEIIFYPSKNWYQPFEKCDPNPLITLLDNVINTNN